jgi:hypothetical protein
MAAERGPSGSWSGHHVGAHRPGRSLGEALSLARRSRSDEGRHWIRPRRLPAPRLVGGRSTAFPARFCIGAPARDYPDVLLDWARGAPAESLGSRGRGGWASSSWPTRSPRRTSNAGMPDARADQSQMIWRLGKAFQRSGARTIPNRPRFIASWSTAPGRTVLPSRTSLVKSSTRRGAVRHISNRFADIHHRATNRPNRLEPWWIFQVWRRP